MNKYTELTKTQAKEIVKRAFSGDSDQYNSAMSNLDSFGWVDGDYKRKIVVCDECRANQTLLFLGYTNECGIFFRWCDLFRIQAAKYLKEIEETVKNDEHMKEYLSTEEATSLLYKAGKALHPRTFKTALDHIHNISLGAKIYAEYLGSPHPLCLVEETTRGIVTVCEPIANLNPLVGIEYLKDILDRRCSKGDEIKTDSINSEKIDKIHSYGLRKCSVKGKEGYLFHRWVELSRPISKYPTIKNPTEFIESRYTMGIVECQDGRITTINPEAILFDKDVRTTVKVGCNGKAFTECIKRVLHKMEEDIAKYDEAMEECKRTCKEFDGRMNKENRKTIGLDKIVYSGEDEDVAEGLYKAMSTAKDRGMIVVLNGHQTHVLDVILNQIIIDGQAVHYEVKVLATYYDD